MIKQLVSPRLSVKFNKTMKKYKFIDLFAGCGGLEDGFLQSRYFKDIAAVEWLKPQVNTLVNRLKTKWNVEDAQQRVMQFDIQRENELFAGWNDKSYGEGKGLDYFVNKANGIDLIIGGPPCQAYSVAGRVRDKNGMKTDYRNFLFEHYLSVVKRYRPKLFVFENVPGILSAAPDGSLIIDKIRMGFKEIGYDLLNNIDTAKVNASDYGVPQNRERIIIIGIDSVKFKNSQQLIENFYNELLPKYKSSKKYTVRDAIGDLPSCTPLYDEENHSKRHSYVQPICNITWHKSRYHNLRDMDTFKLLAEDIASGKREYDSKRISELYKRKIGSSSPIHRYHVLDPNLPSTTIIAHLYKDGNRFIHYDPLQARTITVREAARLQSFDDDFEFIGSQGNAYQMIGNAVPPKLAKCLALAINELLNTMG